MHLPEMFSSSSTLWLDSREWILYYIHGVLVQCWYVLLLLVGILVVLLDGVEGEFKLNVPVKSDFPIPSHFSQTSQCGHITSGIVYFHILILFSCNWFTDNHFIQFWDTGRTSWHSGRSTNLLDAQSHILTECHTLSRFVSRFTLA